MIDIHDLPQPYKVIKEFAGFIPNHLNIIQLIPEGTTVMVLGDTQGIIVFYIDKALPKIPFAHDKKDFFTYVEKVQDIV